MAYTAWSVVFGEQPTAAKWNQLGANDAGFKDGTNIDASAIITSKIADDAVTAAKLQNGIIYRRQGGNSTDPTVSGTSNYDLSGTDMLIQMGFVDVNSVSGVDVTFPVAFSEKPLVFVTAATALLNNAWVRYKQNLTTTTQIKEITFFNSAGSAVTTEKAAWLAIGKK